MFFYEIVIFAVIWVVSGERIEDEELLELSDDLLGVGLGKVGVDK